MTMRNPNNHQGTETTIIMKSMPFPAITELKLGRAVAAVLLVAAVTACDTDVTNPGRYEDQFLDLPSAHMAVVNGSARSLSDGLNDVAYTTAAISRETGWIDIQLRLDPASAAGDAHLRR